MSRVPAFVAFVGPGHRRHAFYEGSHATAVPACNVPTTGQIINHRDLFRGGNAHGDLCARCRRMIERVSCGVTPDHLKGILQ